ncbi:hypothetical protein LVD15_18880 [Fulvivirga maritima]|uniref:hypothetical protein n=1 Tax=Fulvivirga maritima TaxID=2904247 RepID=UPI001F42C49F|nr:hypothetical protein [Fulvivirga maritima]UII25351.1 hypothetical protein LVD15_18880 [Fulvivirga maritima]
MKINKSNLFLILMLLPMIVGAIVTIVQVSGSEEYAISTDNQTITSQHQTSHETKIDQKRTKIDTETAIAIKNKIK